MTILKISLEINQNKDRSSQNENRAYISDDELLDIECNG